MLEKFAAENIIRVEKENIVDLVLALVYAARDFEILSFGYDVDKRMYFLQQEDQLQNRLYLNLARLADIALKYDSKAVIMEDLARLLETPNLELRNTAAVVDRFNYLLAINYQFSLEAVSGMYAKENDEKKVIANTSKVFNLISDFDPVITPTWCNFAGVIFISVVRNGHKLNFGIPNKILKQVIEHDSRIDGFFAEAMQINPVAFGVDTLRR